MKEKFSCSQCGKCCQHLKGNPWYEDLDDGTGVCRFYDRETCLCSIYENRPLKCNVDAVYDLYFKEYMDYSTYVKINTEACRGLKGEQICQYHL